MNILEVCIKRLYLFILYVYVFNYYVGGIENVCRNEGTNINIMDSDTYTGTNGRKRYNIISKDNKTYLLFFKLLGNDKRRVLFLLNEKGNGGSSVIEVNGDFSKNYVYLINKYSAKSWSNSDISLLKELYKLNKYGDSELIDESMDYSILKNGKQVRGINFYGLGRGDVLKISYLKKNILEGSKKVELFLPTVEGEKGSSELILYEDRSLIIVNNNDSGMSIRQLTNIKKKANANKTFQSSYNKNKDDTGVIRYYKLNKGSFGEVWRGLAFTEYLSQPFGDCRKEKEFEVRNLNWRRGELVNHELNSLIMDVLNMLSSNFIKELNIESNEENNNVNNNINVIDIVMKKMMNSLYSEKVLYGIVREVFFGIVLYCSPHISRFLHIFEESIDFQIQSQNSNIWLVYRYEGISLSNLLFEISEDGSLVPSEFWWKNIKNESGDKNLMKDILHQVFIGLKNAHELGIIHRDIKPSNIFISTDIYENEGEELYVRIGDWGSAMVASDYRVDKEVFNVVDLKELQEGLYGEIGPTEEDETEGFQPPEVQFRSFNQEFNGENNRHRYLSYDIWSVGVMMLQIIWGNLEVFSVLNDDSEFQNVVKKIIFHIRQNSEQIKELGFDLENVIRDSTYRLSLMRMCLMDLPNRKDETNSYGVFISELMLKSIGQSVRSGSQEIIGITVKCEDDDFEKFIKKNDISGVGLNDLNAIKLLKKILDPRVKKRITVQEVLEHPYFQNNN